MTGRSYTRQMFLLRRIWTNVYTKCHSQKKNFQKNIRWESASLCSMRYFANFPPMLKNSNVARDNLETKINEKTSSKMNFRSSLRDCGNQAISWEKRNHPDISCPFLGFEVILLKLCRLAPHFLLESFKNFFQSVMIARRERNEDSDSSLWLEQGGY